MANELAAASSFLVTNLKANSVLLGLVGNRVFADFSPEPASEAAEVYPCVVFSLQSASESMAMGARRIFTKPLFFVRIIGKGGYGAISAGADAIDAALHGITDTIVVDGVPYEVTVYRERTMQSSELDNGVRYSWRGGFYRLLIVAPA
jgi:hypothetical protein